MASPFWTYMAQTLRWALLEKPGPLQVFAKGIATRLDESRDDIMFMRDQYFPQRCEPVLVPEHGLSRGLVRHHSETPEQFKSRVINAYAWHMLGGKWEGLPQILNFYGFNTAGLESMSKYQSSRWAEFQVGLQAPSSFEDHNVILGNLETLVWLINEYKPARSVLARLYTDIYNLTPLIWSEGRYSEHFYSHFSGVPATDLGGDWKDKDLILSFGQRLSIEIDAGANVEKPHFSGLQQMGFIAPYLDAPVWSQFCYSDDFPHRHGFTIGELFSFDWCVRTNTSHQWEGAWDSRHWAEPAEWGRVLPKWSIRYREIARSQLVYDDEYTTPQAGLWGGLNACYGIPTAVIINNPPVWGAFSYSADIDRQEIQILEQRLERVALITQPRQTPEPAITIEGTMSIHAAPYKNVSWTEAWDSRKWSAYTAFISVSSHIKELES